MYPKKEYPPRKIPHVYESEKQRKDFNILPMAPTGTACCPDQPIIGKLQNETDIYSPEEF